MPEPHAESLLRISPKALAFFEEMNLAESLSVLAPELIVGATALAVVLLDLFLRRENSYWTGLLALAGAGLAFVLALGQGILTDTGTIFFGTYVADGITFFFRGFFLLALLITIMIAQLSRELDRYRQGEFYAILLTAALSMMLLAAAGNLLLFILAFETLSLMSYVLVAYHKGTRVSTEASLKYLLFGTVASGVMIFGLSYFYGLSGTINLPDCVQAAFSGDRAFVAYVALLLVMAGIGFKISMVPFHFWTPDIYQGAPLPVGAFLSVASKGAGFAALIRIVWPLDGLAALGPGQAVLGEVEANLAIIFGVLAMITMSLGNLVALAQKDFKRLLAYSSIAHAGYMLLAFTNLSDATLKGLLGYLAMYLFMNMAAFLVVVIMENDRRSTLFADFRGYASANPVFVSALVLVLISLVGLPPLVGFFAKFWLFYGVIIFPDGYISPWHITLIVVAVLNTVVSLYYYIYPAKVMVLETGEAAEIEPFERLSLSRWTVAFIVLFITTAPLVYFFLEWPIVNNLLNMALTATTGY